MNAIVRECGSCTACCTHVQVSELNKPAGVPCRHLCGGCGIYATRPTACRAFQCSWLGGTFPLPEWARPDVVGALPETMTCEHDGVQYNIVVWKVFCSRRWLEWREKLLALIDLTNQSYSSIPDGSKREAAFIIVGDDEDEAVIVAGDDSLFFDVFRLWRRNGVRVNFSDGVSTDLLPPWSTNE